MYNNNVPSVSEIESLEAMAQAVAKTRLFGSYSPEQVLILFLVARDLNLPRSVVLAKGINLIGGAIELSARTMNLMIRREGHSVEIVKSNANACILFGRRKDNGDNAEIGFSFEEAQRAGLVKPGGNWHKYPSDMCFARAISRLARRLFPDCIGNCYVEGEIEDERLLNASTEPPKLPKLEQKEMEVELVLPQDLTKEQVEKYVLHVSDTYNASPREIMKAASEKPDSFFAKVRQHCNPAPSSEPEEAIQESTATDQYQALSDPE